MAPTDIPFDALLTLGITLGALALFLWNRLPVEVVGLLVMVTLLLAGLVTREEALSGFANEATITVALLLVLSVGLLRTGAVDVIGRWIGRLARGSETRLLVAVVLLVVPVSAFLNNTAVVAILVPTLIGLSREVGGNASKLLMPLSFASQMGGSLTLIGTSTNLLVAGMVLDLGVGRIGLFDMTLPALAFAVVGVLYLLTVGRWLTPRRPTEEDLLQQYELRDYLIGLEVERGSRLADRSLAETNFGDRYGLNVLIVERKGRRIQYPYGGTILRERDLLLVQGKIPDIARIQETEGLRIAGSAPSWRRSGQDDEEVPVPRLAEVMIPPRSHLIGRTVKQLGFRARFRVNALAIQRHGHAFRERIGRIALEAGDILLVQGPAEAIQGVHDRRDLSLLGAVEFPAKRKGKRRMAVAIMAGVVLLPALDVVPIVVSALLGVILMLITGCVRPTEAYEEMDWSVVILLASILPLGIAMQTSGAAAFMARALLGVTAGAGPQGVLAAFFLLTIILTAVISNAAAAAVLTPMAVAVGAALAVSPMPFIIGVMIAASNSFLTPIGYQTNLFVHGPGGYRFSDFARVGGPLTVLSVVTATLVIPLVFPF